VILRKVGFYFLRKGETILCNSLSGISRRMSRGESMVWMKSKSGIETNTACSNLYAETKRDDHLESSMVFTRGWEG
jgi:hypothetical protein